MDEKYLDFDRSKHICYSQKVKEIIISHLKQKYDENEVLKIWEKIQIKYCEYLKDLPFLGGKHCRHNGPGGTYDCICIFAFYEVQDDKPSLDELYEMNNATFLPPFKRLSKITNLNNKTQQKLISKIFKVTSKADIKLEKNCPTGYIMRVDPYDEKIGVRYHFDRCPIAEFAKAHNLTHIMPAFCNGDYPAMELLHAGLIREHTCANSNICDYWIVGDKSDYLRKYPVVKREDGYLYNPGLNNVESENTTNL